MTVQSWFLYIALVVIATSTPGPAVLFITTNSLLHGWRKSIYAAIGNIIGLLCLGIIAITGLGAVLRASEFMFSIIKYAGAAYLVFLGLKMMYQKDVNFETMKNRSNSMNVSSQKLFFQAFGVAISNPKAIIFLTALFPQFVNTNNPVIPQFSLLILILMLFSFSFLLLYSMLAHQAKAWLTQPGRVKAVNRAGGSIFVGFGILLAASQDK